ncbi:hypothetical protein ACLK1Y_00285 [Escherichia coli]
MARSVSSAAISANDQFERPVALGQLDREIRTNPGGFAGSDNDTSVLRH